MALVQTEGFDEFLLFMQQMPDRLLKEAEVHVSQAADDTLSAIRLSYPEKSGNLKRGLRKVKIPAGAGVVGYRVENTAKIAWIFENGAMARGTMPRETRSGANRGIMPPGNVFIPIAVRRRQVMYERLTDMLRREGFTVFYAP